MSGYKIFKPNTGSDIAGNFEEVGASYTIVGGVRTVIFSDGTSISLKDDFSNGKWIIIDDDAHFIYQSTASAIADAAIKDTHTTQYIPFMVVAETVSDGVICEKTTGNDVVMSYLNTSQLNQANSDGSLSELTIVAAVGCFTGNITDPRHIFKDLFINYKRWFQFGDVITTSNGDQYIGFGWFLHKIGG